MKNLRRMSVVTAIFIVGLLAVHTEAGPFSIKLYNSDGSRVAPDPKDVVALSVKDKNGQVYHDSTTDGTFEIDDASSNDPDLSLTFEFTRGGRKTTLKGINGGMNTPKQYLDIIVRK